MIELTPRPWEDDIPVAKEPLYQFYSILPELLQLYQLYLYDLKEQAQDKIPSSPPSFEGFMHYLTTLYEI